MGGFVYLIVEWDNMTSNSNNVKIGSTKKNPKNRLKELQTGNSSKLAVLSSYETMLPHKLEKLLHMHYHRNKLNGEWFNMTDKDVAKFRDVCREKESVIELLTKENCFYK
jgi:hypothetical protein